MVEQLLKHFSRDLLHLEILVTKAIKSHYWEILSSIMNDFHKLFRIMFLMGVKSCNVL